MNDSLLNENKDRLSPELHHGREHSYLHSKLNVAIPDLIAPVDKWYLRVQGNIDLTWIEPCRNSYKKPSTRTGFLMTKTGVYNLPNGAQITVFGSDSETILEINPSQWVSYTGMIKFLEKFFGSFYPEVQVTLEAYHSDTPISLEDAEKSAIYHRKVCLTKRTYHSEAYDRKTRGGRVSETSHTSTAGTRRTRNVKQYNSAKKHGFQDPMTRVEITNPFRKHVYIEHPDDLGTLLERVIFAGEISHCEVVPHETLSRKQTEKLKGLLIKVHEKGLDLALKESRTADTNFDRDFKSIVTLKPIKTELDSHFHKRLKRFIDEPISEIETEIVESEVLHPRKPSLSAPKHLDISQRLKLNIIERERNIRATASSLKRLIILRWEQHLLESGKDPRTETIPATDHLLHKPPCHVFRELRDTLIILSKQERWQPELLKPIQEGSISRMKLMIELLLRALMDSLYSLCKH
ncbi:MAG: hypothetical protein EXR74_02250 [Bdellovibrionales bacterium]|nr:hypothetical protein [Bdellovibrionales bacterium]